MSDLLSPDIAALVALLSIPAFLVIMGILDARGVCRVPTLSSCREVETPSAPYRAERGMPIMLLPQSFLSERGQGLWGKSEEKGEGR